MLTLQIRVPSNAHSFKLSTNFFSAEFPEWTCSSFNDFFVVLLDSTYAGDPPNPMDKNLAFYQPPGTTNKVSVGADSLIYDQNTQIIKLLSAILVTLGNNGNGFVDPEEAAQIAILQ